ncbi:hypothetical protein MA16_Dca025513 [Dendrobium catenatum]|uniref:Uncharacterized protein n=1 Tax=Dendrobium catenatum TaxID=906689 RepID=A0A2I0WZ40_9ASPA|nr:hypothetical protein MA16_Dca025513 [Dendrobium catenatum]
MVDIASFVADDFERRTKKLEKGEEYNGFEFSSTIAMASSALLTIKEKLTEELIFVRDDIEKRARNPTSSFSLAAFNGFFSA